GDHRLETPPHRLIFGPVDIDAAETLRYRHHAGGERYPGHDLMLAARLFEPHQFGRTAADIEDERIHGVALHQGFGAHGGELRLHLAPDDLEFEPHLVAHARDEGLAIGRHAAGLGRDQAPVPDPVPGELV